MCKDTSINYVHMVQLTQCPVAATMSRKKHWPSTQPSGPGWQKKNFIEGYKFVGESLLAYCLPNYAVDFTIFNIWA